LPAPAPTLVRTAHILEDIHQNRNKQHAHQDDESGICRDCDTRVHINDGRRISRDRDRQGNDEGLVELIVGCYIDFNRFIFRGSYDLRYDSGLTQVRIQLIGHTALGGDGT